MGVDRWTPGISAEEAARPPRKPCGGEEVHAPRPLIPRPISPAISFLASGLVTVWCCWQLIALHLQYTHLGADRRPALLAHLALEALGQWEQQG